MDTQVEQKVAAALLIIQVAVIVSVFVGASLSGYWSRSRPLFIPARDRSIFSSGVLDFALLLLWLLLTIAPILLTQFFKIGWDALGFEFSIVSVRQATLIAGFGVIGYVYWPQVEPYGEDRMRRGSASWLLAAAMLSLTTALGYIRSLPFA